MDESRYKYRVSGVPFFVIEDKYALSGAQEPEAFEEIINKITGKTAAHKDAQKVDACTRDGVC